MQRVGSARSCYGNTSAGDQHCGDEVSTQAYYDHSKKWDVLISTVPGMDKYIADAMEKACKNNDIGYDQATRNTLWENIKGKAFDPSRTSKKVNTDCSALVRVCVQYACHMCGVEKDIPNFTTSNQVKVLLATGLFKKLGSKYEKQGVYLPRGAILVTKTKGHTVVVLDRGSKCDIPIEEPVQGVGDLIVTGDSVNIRAEVAKVIDPIDTVKKNTLLQGINCDGWFPILYGKFIYWVAESMCSASEESVIITGSSVNIRIGPGKDYLMIHMAHEGDIFKRPNLSGWTPIEYRGACYWIASKYVRKI